MYIPGGKMKKGVLGHTNNANDSHYPKKIDNLSKANFISAGKICICITSDEDIYIWGDNYGNKPNLIKNKFDSMHINNNFLIGISPQKNIWVKNIHNLSHGYYINNLKINLCSSYDNLIIGVENLDINSKENYNKHLHVSTSQTKK